jgi:hypothetical protein
MLTAEEEGHEPNLASTPFPIFVRLTTKNEKTLEVR